MLMEQSRFPIGMLVGGEQFLGRERGMREGGEWMRMRGAIEIMKSSEFECFFRSGIQGESSKLGGGNFGWGIEKGGVERGLEDGLGVGEDALVERVQLRGLFRVGAMRVEVRLNVVVVEGEITQGRLISGAEGME